ncbi:MAG: hypothetical protein AAFR81_19160 [Chloroflexota bacterium]
MSLDYKRIMQEQLDGELDPQMEAELLEHLQMDEEAATEMQKLDNLHDRLATAPAMRAPRRLAATIMAKLSKQLEKQAQMEPLSQEMKQAIMLTLSIVQIAMMPVMVAATYMVMNAQYNPAILTRVMQQTIMLMVMMIDGLTVMLEKIERMVEKDPQSAPVAMALIPVALMGMVDYIEELQKDMDWDDF